MSHADCNRYLSIVETRSFTLLKANSSCPSLSFMWASVDLPRYLRTSFNIFGAECKLKSKIRQSTGIIYKRVPVEVEQTRSKSITPCKEYWAWVTWHPVNQTKPSQSERNFWLARRASSFQLSTCYWLFVQCQTNLRENFLRGIFVCI